MKIKIFLLQDELQFKIKNFKLEFIEYFHLKFLPYKITTSISFGTVLYFKLSNLVQSCALLPRMLKCFVVKAFLFSKVFEQRSWVMSYDNVDEIVDEETHYKQNKTIALQ